VLVYELLNVPRVTYQNAEEINRRVLYNNFLLRTLERTILWLMCT